MANDVINGSLKKLLEDDFIAISDALRAAVGDAGKNLQSRLRTATSAAGLGYGLEKSWRLQVYPPPNKRTAHPAALVWSKAPKIIGAFDEGATITARNAKWLVLPLPAAKELGFDRQRRGRFGQRAKWSDMQAALNRFGATNIRFVRGKTGRLIVVADLDQGALRKNGRYGYRALRAGRKAKASVALFVLVRRVTLPRIFELQNAAKQAENELFRRVVENVRLYG